MGTALIRLLAGVGGFIAAWCVIGYVSSHIPGFTAYSLDGPGLLIAIGIAILAAFVPPWQGRRSDGSWLPRKRDKRWAYMDGYPVYRRKDEGRSRDDYDD